jgi:hypothetical protein
MNDHGDVTVGGSDTGIPDPLGEDACGFPHPSDLSFVRVAPRQENAGAYARWQQR